MAITFRRYTTLAGFQGTARAQKSNVTAEKGLGLFLPKAFEIPHIEIWDTGLPLRLAPDDYYHP